MKRVSSAPERVHDLLIETQRPDLHKFLKRMLSYFECDSLRVVTNRIVITLMYFLNGLGLHMRAGFKSPMELKQLKLNLHRIIM